MASAAFHTSPMRLFILMFIPALMLLLSVIALYDSIPLFQRVYDLRPNCNLTEICPWYAARPTLPDGSQSTAIFDVPRRMLHHIPPHVISFLSPTARLVTHIQRPRIIVYDSALPPRFQSHLLVRANAALYTKRKRHHNNSLESQQVVFSPDAYDDEVCIAFHYWAPINICVTPMVKEILTDDLVRNFDLDRQFRGR